MKPALVFIVGPTVSGKTAAAISLATELPGIEIVNADSRQVYHGMSIGTAQPAAAELAAVPHHLVDIVSPDEPFSLATFLTLARNAVTDILSRGKTPVVVGGSGQYVWGLAEGWQAPEVPAQTGLRARLEQEADEHGGEALHTRLANLDAGAAELIDAKNIRRVVRALEVIEVTGKPFSGQRRKVAPLFTPHLFALDVPRTELHRRIDARVETMVEAGWLAEVQALLDAGYEPELPAFSSAGYREIASHLRGEISLEEALDRTTIATHRLARGQGTWFRKRDERIKWVSTASELASIARQALDN
jgi:tRNA dimethylallyltransferase